MFVLAAGALVRFHGIDAQVVIDDEWHALNAVQYHDYRWIFTHFSRADISIPLALLYELQYELIGLNELLMRWPMLLAGMVAILLLPFLLRRWLTAPERVLFAALIALSPFLIYYSRLARPYMLLALLEPTALLLAWRWWKTGKPVYVIGWILCASFSAWFNPPALAIVTAPFVWFGLLALRDIGQPAGRRNLLWLLVIGLAMLAPLAALLGPPLAGDFGSIANKSGQHSVTWATLSWTLSLAAGSGHPWIYVPVGLLALFGLLTLHRRDAGFARFLAAVLILAMIAIVLARPDWIEQGPVFLRYLIGMLPFFLGCVAIGTFRALGWLLRRFGAHGRAVPGACGVFALFMVATGPVPAWPLFRNQFPTHLYYQFHFNPQRNPFVSFIEGWYREEPWYAEIASEHPAGDAIVVEAPWYLESFNNALHLQQNVHGQRVVVGFVNGLCSGPLYGEIRTGQPGMKFRNFIYLEDLLNGTRSADYLVLRRRSMSPPARVIHMDYPECEHAVRARFGEPWRESEYSLVFRLNKVKGKRGRR